MRAHGTTLQNSHTAAQQRTPPSSFGTGLQRSLPPSVGSARGTLHLTIDLKLGGTTAAI
eukprot:CAMPEP_0174312632 /NCGR_PEP_ID=MMETSP0810-20121108/4409_1 /TAXON_ID=73025 ORGANISM="Eutreptiella gymnastica-like, Strain CCMP1594" /NCGR_SAMPLE_ID=MMETSP0810 /ASSEMBLY_ACC=CAM_ASM_000659 /LENGTH=58 /DNA_ID=CAMNT_0015421069 /DNA_START=277 /DNA_END=453 /DNA_ORIENTATION=+